MNQQPNQQPEQQSLMKENAKIVHFLIRCTYCSVYPLRLYSRHVGTLGIMNHLPDGMIAFFVMMLVTLFYGGSLLSWWFACYSFYLALAHALMFLWLHYTGRDIHPYYVGTPLFGSELQCDIAVASLLDMICLAYGDVAFATWWMLNIPLSALACNMLRFRDFLRVIWARRMRQESQYWQMIHHSHEEDFE